MRRSINLLHIKSIEMAVRNTMRCVLIKFAYRENGKVKRVHLIILLTDGCEWCLVCVCLNGALHPIAIKKILRFRSNI